MCGHRKGQNALQEDVGGKIAAIKILRRYLCEINEEQIMAGVVPDIIIQQNNLIEQIIADIENPTPCE